MLNILKFVRMESEPSKKSNVLVLGSAGVGKTSFIKALKQYVSGTPQTFSEDEYNTTKYMNTDQIPEINTREIDSASVLNNRENGKYCKYIADFMVDSHYYKDERFFLLERGDMLYGNIPEETDVGEITICELSSQYKEFDSKFHELFDKIIIMCDYHDIGTMRSVQTWAELIGAPIGKIIVCINKCDKAPVSYTDDFQERKAQILRHYSEQCKLEFISVKTLANIGFLYKYAN